MDQKNHKGFKELEKIFWVRTWNAHKKFNILGKILIFPPMLIIIAFAHYAFAAMHNTTILFQKKV